MIKYIFVFCLGFLTSALFNWFGYQNTVTASKTAVANVVEEVTDLKYEQCKKNYLELTNCYQRLSINECDAQIMQQCNTVEEE